MYQNRKEMEHSFSFVNIPEVTNIRFNIFKKRKKQYDNIWIRKDQQTTAVNRPSGQEYKSICPKRDYHTGGIYRYKNGSPKMEPFIFQNT